MAKRKKKEASKREGGPRGRRCSKGAWCIASTYRWSQKKNQQEGPAALRWTGGKGRAHLVDQRKNLVSTRWGGKGAEKEDHATTGEDDLETSFYFLAKKISQRGGGKRRKGKGGGEKAVGCCRRGLSYNRKGKEKRSQLGKRKPESQGECKRTTEDAMGTRSSRTQIERALLKKGQAGRGGGQGRVHRGKNSIGPKVCLPWWQQRKERRRREDDAAKPPAISGGKGHLAGRKKGST